jgi:hypothetical protein
MGLVGEFGPRDYFILHNDEAIAKMQVQIEASAHPGCPPRGGGLLKAAQSRAWEECEDKERYEEMARNHDPELYVTFLMLCCTIDPNPSQCSRCPSLSPMCRSEGPSQAGCRWDLGH